MHSSGFNKNRWTYPRLCVTIKSSYILMKAFSIKFRTKHLINELKRKRWPSLGLKYPIISESVKQNLIKWLMLYLNGRRIDCFAIKNCYSVLLLELFLDFVVVINLAGNDPTAVESTMLDLRSLIFAIVNLDDRHPIKADPFFLVHVKCLVVVHAPSYLTMPVFVLKLGLAGLIELGVVNRQIIFTTSNHTHLH